MSEERALDPQKTLEMQAITPSDAGDDKDKTPQASLIVLAGWEIGRVITLTESETVLGRALDLAMPLTSPSVSRHHARLVRREQDAPETYWVFDLNSTNGIQVNNKPVASTQLREGDKLQIGDVVFRFTFADPLDADYHQEIHRRIHYNQLTGLLTLDTFLQHLQGAIEQASGIQEPLVVAMTDLDGLKRVNDTYGHQAGSMVIRTMGEIIRSVMRNHDRAGLYGGDETILLWPRTDLETARTFAEKLRLAIEARIFEHNGQEFHVSISQGLAEWPTHGQAIARLIAAADGALYQAKAAGRNRVCVAEA